MIKLERSLKLPYSSAQIYALVADIEQYPAFLPYCQQSSIHWEQNNDVKASLVAGYKGLQYRFITHNKNIPDQQISMQLSAGPFKSLEGTWKFADAEQGCVVTIELQAEFKNKLLNMMLKNKLNHFTDIFIDAFVQRARELYD